MIAGVALVHARVHGAIEISHLCMPANTLPEARRLVGLPTLVGKRGDCENSNNCQSSNSRQDPVQ